MRADAWLDTAHLQGDIKRKSISGALASTLAEGITFFTSLATTMALARLLTPGDYGLVAMAAVAYVFLSLFQHLGLSTAVIQRATVTHAQVSNLFWINALAGAMLTILGVAAAPAVAALYGSEALRPVFAGLCLSFVISGLDVQHRALLSRQMRFGLRATVSVLATIAGSITGVICALCGLGYWSLVVMSVAVAVYSVIGHWSACSWRPGRPRRGVGTRGLVTFGAELTASTLLTFLSRQSDNFLLGKFWGEGELGLYDRAYKLLLFPMQKINQPMAAVVIPGLSRLLDQPARYRSYFLKVLHLSLLGSIPIVGLAFALADELILVVLGPQWVRATDVFIGLAVAAVTQPMRSCCVWLLVSAGHSRRVLRWEALMAPLMVCAFCAGLPWGILGVAWAYSAANLLTFVPGLLYSIRLSPVSGRDIAVAAASPYIATTLAVLAVLGLESWGVLSAESTLVQLVVKGVAFSLTYALALLAFGERKGVLADVLRTVRGR